MHMIAGNFHILYALFSSAFPLRSSLMLTTASDYTLLTQKSPSILQSIDTSPSTDMAPVLLAMDALAFPPDTREVRRPDCLVYHSHCQHYFHYLNSHFKYFCACLLISNSLNFVVVSVVDVF
jgi:hypothetical protein